MHGFLVLVDILQNIICKSKKHNGLLNQDKLCSRFHETTSSNFFKVKYISQKSFYEHISDKVFERLIKETVASQRKVRLLMNKMKFLHLRWKMLYAIYVGVYVVHSSQTE